MFINFVVLLKYMKKTSGIGIIANGVISRYGLKLTYHDEKLFMYESLPDSLGIVRSISELEDGKDIYLYELRKVVGFGFFYYNGMNNAKVHVHHPREAEMIQMIDNLSKEFKSIKIPTKIVEQIKNPSKYDGIIDSYKPLDNWAKKFIKEFSPFLQKAKY